MIVKCLTFNLDVKVQTPWQTVFFPIFRKGICPFKHYVVSPPSLIRVESQLKFNFNMKYINPNIIQPNFLFDELNPNSHYETRIKLMLNSC